MLTTTSLRPIEYAKGIIILLQNGRKLIKPNVLIKTTVNSDAEFELNASFFLEASDRALLKTAPIKGFELHDAQRDVVRPDEIYKMFICLLDKK